MALTFGTLGTNSTGQQVLGGINSGIDPTALLTGLTQTLQNQVTPIQDQVTLNTNKIAALQQFNRLMSTLQTASAQLSNPSGFNQASNNAFDYVKAAVTASDGTTASNYITVTADPGVAPQTYTLGSVTSPAVIQLAQAKQQATNTFSVASADAALVTATPGAGDIGAGTVVLNIPGGGTESITLNAGDSLNSVANNFNAVATQTGIAATVIQVAPGTYDLQFSAVSTGKAADFSLHAGDSDSVINSDPSGVLSNLTFTTTQDAQDSKFTLNGQVIQRSTNNVSDAISGITFNLLQPTPTAPSNTTLTVALTPDTTTAENSIVNFMNAYNAIMTFYAQQTQLNSDGTYASTSYLAQDSTLTLAINQMQTEVSQAVAGLSANGLNSLGSIGVSFTSVPAQTDSTGAVTTPAVTNALTYDQSTLEAALQSNFSAVSKIFGFSFTSSDSNLVVNTRTNSLATTGFTLDAAPSTNTFQATYTDGTGSHTVALTATPFSSGGGFVLTGPAGSALDGLSMLYGSTADNTNITVSLSQGIGDRITNLSAALSTANTGSIAQDVTGLQTSNTSLNNNITQINQQIATQKALLQTKITQMEQAISSANTLLATLTAQTNAGLAASAQG